MATQCWPPCARLPEPRGPTRYPMRMSALICLSTCPDRETAERIADALVEARLAACVNIVPGVESVYLWQGHFQILQKSFLLMSQQETWMQKPARR